ncbi:MAG: hypothetical protein ACREVI_11500, partial [Steroidobacteraceae bacterium]
MAMRTLLCGVTVVLLSVPIQAADQQAAIYDQDPEHLWNRLYRAVAVRTEGGIQGDFQRSSQHLVNGGVVWDGHQGGLRNGRAGRRCGRRVGQVS